MTGHLQCQHQTSDFNAFYTNKAIENIKYVIAHKDSNRYLHPEGQIRKEEDVKQIKHSIHDFRLNLIDNPENYNNLTHKVFVYRQFDSGCLRHVKRE